MPLLWRIALAEAKPFAGMSAGIADAAAPSQKQPMQRLHLLAFLTASALALSGCVVAAVPVVAGGMVARSAVKGRSAPQARVRTTAPAAPSSVQAAQAAALPARPADIGAMRPGQFYAGALPSPASALPAPTSPAAVPASESPRTEAPGWSDVGHYVAANLSPEHSALLARGSGAADPRWVPCAGKPAAVLAAAATVLAPDLTLVPAARSWLEALRVLGARTVLVASTPEQATAARAAFSKADLPVPAEGDALIVADTAGQLLATRTNVGARYCVVALVGRSGADFPNGLTPATTPATLGSLWGNGWFLLPGPAR